MKDVEDKANLDDSHILRLGDLCFHTNNSNTSLYYETGILFGIQD